MINLDTLAHDYLKQRSRAPIVTVVPFLESRPQMGRRKVDAACTLSPEAIRARSRRKSTTDNGASEQLGHGRPRIGNRIAWAHRQLLLGSIVARYGWALEAEPKRLSFQLYGVGSLELLLCWYVGGEKPELFSTVTWADISANDWYLVTQLELSK